MKNKDIIKRYREDQKIKKKLKKNFNFIIFIFIYPTLIAGVVGVGGFFLAFKSGWNVIYSVFLGSMLGFLVGKLNTLFMARSLKKTLRK